MRPLLSLLHPLLLLVSHALAGPLVSSIAYSKVSNQTIQGSNDSVSSEPHPIPRDFNAVTRRLAGDPLNPKDVYGLLNYAGGRLALRPYNADMSTMRFQWPRNSPRVYAEFTAAPERTISVHHQLWALLVCLPNVIAPDPLPPFDCSFGFPHGVGDVGRLRVVIVDGDAIDNRTDLTTTAAITPVETQQLSPVGLPSRVSESSTITRMMKRSNDSKDPTNSGADVDVDLDAGMIGETNDPGKLIIPDFDTNQPLDPGKLCLDALLWMIVFASYVAEQKAFQAHGGSSVTGDQDKFIWVIRPHAGGPTIGWNDLIITISAVYGYMVGFNKFYVCSWAWLLNDQPYLLGRFEEFL